MQETWVRSLGWEDPLEKEMATHSLFLPGKFLGQRSLVSYSPWGCKEPDATERLHFHYKHKGSFSCSLSRSIRDWMRDLLHLFHPVGLKMTKHLPCGHCGSKGKRREDNKASVDSCSFHSEMNSYYHFHFLAQCEVRARADTKR